MSAERTFATGEWYAVVGDAVTVLLPGAERGRVAGLWDLADAGASADALLDALVAGGLSSLTDFALVADDDEATRVIVRGTPTATVTTGSGEQAVSAAPGTTWNEQVITGVTGVRVDLGGGSAAADHVLTPGLARVSAFELGRPASVETSIAGTVVDQAHRSEERSPELNREEPVHEEPLAEPFPVPFPVPVTSPDGSSDDLVPPAGASSEEPLTEPEPEPQPEPEPEAEAEVEVEPEADPTPTGETPAVSDDDWSDRDGQTVIGSPTPDFERPPVPGQEIAPEVVSRPVASLVFSTGDVVEVDRAVLVGRAPEARQFASHDQPHVVTVSSPNQEISSTHLEIRPGAGADHGSAIATDLGSTNGTVLVQPGLAPEELTPGIAVSLIPGAVLDLGDGVTIQVTNP